MVTHASDSVAGLPVPRTPLARDITDYVREAEDDLLFDHSRRVYLFGVLHGRQRGLEPDLELLYAAAMFHDVGLTDPYRSTSTVRFEVDSADVAREFLLDRGVDPVRLRTVWLSIALHTTPGIPEFLEPEIALVHVGVQTDVLGSHLDAIPPAAVDAITTAHPRPNFKERILAAFAEGMRHRPRTTFGTVNADVLAHQVPGFIREDFAEIILRSRWPE